MDWKLELVAIPVSDVDRAKAFYTEQVGFIADYDHRVSADLRFVQLTPPGSACSIAMGTGVVDTQPDSAPATMTRIEPKQSLEAVLFDATTPIVGGFLQSLIGLDDYRDFTGDVRGTSLFRAGHGNAKAIVPLSDTGSYAPCEKTM